MATQILIADDHPLFRQALESVIRSIESDAKVRAVGTVSEAVGALTAEPYNLVLLDLVLPGAERLSGLNDLKRAAPDTPVAIVSAHRDASIVDQARAFGASGFVPKAVELAVLHEAMACLLKGEKWFPPAEPRGAADEAHDDAVERIGTLSPAQRIVLDALLAGRVNKQIARDMDISLATVKAHVSGVLRKLGVDTRTQAVLLARPVLEISDG
ncbi:MAG TPA: response regulator transcription factor [Sphingomonas sp.]|jgi:DNA-binding NarL/FixJ family response regulator|nr:response regulator transcription factor [Sphingomonas sp.]